MGTISYLGGWTQVVDTESCCDAETLQEHTFTLSEKFHRTTLTFHMVT